MKHGTSSCIILFPNFILITALLSSTVTRSSSAAFVPVNVGVIIDRSSWVGNISWTCMSLALDDFYASNSNYTTRLSLHLRDSGPDDDDDNVFTAAAAAVDLLKNVGVQAIIGPQRSTQAKFLIQLGNRYHVPIISFSAKSPSFSPSQNPYFFRTAWNDSSQAKVIASIAQAFGWGEVVPVFEDTEYGNGIVPCIIDAFEDSGARVPYRSPISLSATKEEILVELRRLNESRTRVFVVHMTYELGFRLFSAANEEGMMGDGYVWIVTYGFTDILNLYGQPAIDVMQGVLGLKPHVRDSKKLQDFEMRWRKQYNQKAGVQVREPTMFGLWAYDTVWALAMAAESLGAVNNTDSSTNSSTDLGGIGTSQTGTMLRKSLLTTKFKGMSGEFELVDGQLESKAFEIINVVSKGANTVGFWTPAYGFSKYLNSKTKLDNDTIMWPGGNKTVPKGWQWPTWGRKLRIGVPVKPGFSQFIKVTRDPITNQANATGYCAKVFEAVLKNLPYDVPFEYIAYENNEGEMNGTYDDLVYQVYLQNFDAVVGDITIVANRSLYVDFTLPYTESGVSMVVPVKDELKKNALTFLKPLTADLWLISGAFFFFTGLVVWFLEREKNEQFSRNGAGKVLYFSFSTLVFAHKDNIMTNLAKIVVIVWVFVVWILQSSYTASLTSILTVQQLEPTVTDLNELIQKQNRIGYLDDSFMPSLLERLGVKKSNLIAYSSPTEYNEALTNGSVAAIFDEIPYLKVFLAEYCGKYTMIGHTYKTAGFGFVFPKGSPLVPDMSKAILNLTETQEMIDFNNELYNNQSCPYLVDISAPSSSNLTLRSFWGLFVISGSTSLIALALHFIFFVHERRQELHVGTETSGVAVLQMLALLARLYSKQDEPAQAPENAEAQQLGDANVIALNSVLQTPSSLSNYTYEMSGTENDDDNDDIVSVAEDEGTPGREIGNREYIGSPSFSDMLHQR